MPDKETRYNPTKLEVRDATTSGSVGQIGGYAAVFNQLSEPLGRFREKIANGAFTDSLNSDVRAFWNHNTDALLGRTTSKTLRIEQNDLGLAFSLDLPDTQAGRDTLTSIKRGDVSGMSFGFMVSEDSWQRGKAGEPHVRTLLKVDLYEVSPVVFPAYPQTSVGTRDMEQLLKELETKWAYEDNEQSAPKGLSIVDARKQLFKIDFNFRVGNH